jgi:four helix bundle protein
VTQWQSDKVARSQCNKVAERHGVDVIRRFEDLEVWRVAQGLAKGVYRAARTQELRNDYALLNQMKRSAISVSSNIAEGFERGSRKQHIEFAYIAKGSAGELRSQVILAQEVGLLDEQAYAWLMKRCEMCSKMLSAYSSSLKRTGREFRGLKYQEPEAVDA